MIGLRAAHHEPTYHLPQGDIHILADEDDAVEVVRHQLATKQLDIACAGCAKALRFLRSELPLEGRYILPAAQHGLTKLARADIRAIMAIAAQLAQEWAAMLSAKCDEVDPPTLVIDELAPSMGKG